jgi:hypothetical protein
LKYSLSNVEHDKTINDGFFSLYGRAELRNQSFIRNKKEALEIGVYKPIKRDEQFLKLKEKERRRKQFSFLPFFFEKEYSDFYQTKLANFYSIAFIVSYGLSRDNFIEAISYSEGSMINLPATYKDYYFEQFAISNAIKRDMYYIDENFYNFRLPNWMLHKDKDSFQIVDATGFENEIIESESDKSLREY